MCFQATCVVMEQLGLTPDEFRFRVNNNRLAISELVGMNAALLVSGMPSVIDHIDRYEMIAVATVNPIRALDILIDEHVLGRRLGGEFVRVMEKVGLGERLREILSVECVRGGGYCCFCGV